MSVVVVVVARRHTTVHVPASWHRRAFALVDDLRALCGPRSSAPPGDVLRGLRLLLVEVFNSPSSFTGPPLSRSSRPFFLSSTPWPSFKSDPLRLRPCVCNMVTEQDAMCFLGVSTTVAPPSRHHAATMPTKLPPSTAKYFPPPKHCPLLCFS